MPQPDLLGRLHWQSEDELRRTLELNPRAGADDDLPPHARFVRNVAMNFERRYPVAAGANPGNAVFLLSPLPPEAVPASTDHFGIDEGGTDFVDGAWFVNEEAKRARKADVPSDFDEQCRQILGWGLGDVAAVTVRKTTDAVVMSFYPNGLNSDISKLTVRLGGAPVTLDEILSLVARIHFTTLVTPDAHSGGASPWAKAEKYWVDTRAELCVQSHLKTGLAAGLPKCIISIEGTAGPAGRYDIVVTDEATRQPLTVLELKILRSFGVRGGTKSLNYNRTWAASGVIQAKAYQDQIGANNAALCCFDMRKNSSDPGCMVTAETSGASLDVKVHRWILYPSNEAWRHATYSDAKSSKSG